MSSEIYPSEGFIHPKSTVTKNISHQNLRNTPLLLARPVGQTLDSISSILTTLPPNCWAAKRYRIIQRYLMGKSGYAVAKDLHIQLRTAYHWISRYKAGCIIDANKQRASFKTRNDEGTGKILNIIFQQTINSIPEKNNHWTATAMHRRLVHIGCTMNTRLKNTAPSEYIINKVWERLRAEYLINDHRLQDSLTPCKLACIDEDAFRKGTMALGSLFIGFNKSFFTIIDFSADNTLIPSDNDNRPLDTAPLAGPMKLFRKLSPLYLAKNPPQQTILPTRIRNVASKDVRDHLNLLKKKCRKLGHRYNYKIHLIADCSKTMHWLWRKISCNLPNWNPPEAQFHFAPVKTSFINSIINILSVINKDYKKELLLLRKQIETELLNPNNTFLDSFSYVYPIPIPDSHSKT